MKEMNKTPKTDWVAPIILLIIAICAQVALFKLNDYLGTVTQKKYGGDNCYGSYELYSRNC